MDEQQPYTPPPAAEVPPPNDYAQPAPVLQAGISDNVAAVLAYIFAVPVAIIFLLIDPYKTRPFVRFHCFQALGIVVGMMALQVLHIIPILGSIVALVGVLVLLVYWLIGIVKAYQGEMYQVPIIGKIAAEQANKPA